jgi:hypothetical protein
LVGVNVTLAEYVPTGGTVAGAVKAKVPAMLGVPPERVDDARVCPYIKGLADGQTDTVGVALLTVWVVVVEEIK